MTGHHRRPFICLIGFLFSAFHSQDVNAAFWPLRGLQFWNNTDDSSDVATNATDAYKNETYYNNTYYEDDDGSYYNNSTSGGGSGSSAPSNDQCDSALDLGTLPFRGYGSTVLATEEEYGLTSCGVRDSHKGIWYTFTTDTRIAVNATIGFQEAVIVILQGADEEGSTSCDFLECVGYKFGDSYTYYASNQATYTWIAEPGMRYYILVSSTSYYNDLYRFELQVFSYETPVNDECTGATVIDSIPYTAKGTTQGALTDMGLATCGISSSSRGVWYQFTPSAGKVTKIATGYFRDLVVSIFSGTCDFLMCMGNAEYSRYEEEENGLVYEWIAEADTTYYILVTGSREESVGEYQFQLSQIDPPDHDKCANAIAVPTDAEDSLPYTDRGTTIGSLPDFAGTSYCSSSSQEARGVWYSITGGGKVMRASVLLSRSDRYYSSNPIIGIYAGDCAYLSCVETAYTNNNYNQENSAVLEWIAEVGMTYYILVAAHSAAYVGNYRITITEDPLPANDKCDDAVVIDSAPFKTIDTTIGSLIDMPFQTCDLGQTSRGVWYTYTGTGKTTRASMFANFQDRYYGHALALFTGACDFLLCHSRAGNPYVYQRQDGMAWYEWYAEEGVQYYIYAAGSDFQYVGNFQLQLSERELPPNDNCSNPVSINPLPFTQVASILGASPDFEFPACGVERPKWARGVWYAMVGHDKMTRVSVVGSGGSHNSIVSVFTGTCGELLQCVQHSRDSNNYNNDYNNYYEEYDGYSATAVFHAQDRLLYYVLVSSTEFNDQSSGMGRFQIRVLEHDVPANNDCADATVIQDLPFMDIGDTTGAMPDVGNTVQHQHCGVNASSTRGVWYSFVGDGRQVTASVGYFDMVLAVFAGGCDSTLTCVGSAYGSSYNAQPAQYTLATQQFTPYLFYVSGNHFNVAGKYQFKLMQHQAIQ